MDDQLRTLERAVNSGREDLIPLYGEARIRAGLFWAEQVSDEYLGSCWSLRNLETDEGKLDIVVGRNFIQRGPRYAPSRPPRSVRDMDLAPPELHRPIVDPQGMGSPLPYSWFSYLAHRYDNPGRIRMLNPSLFGCIARTFYQYRAHPAFAEQVTAYRADFARLESYIITLGRVERYDANKLAIEYMLPDGTLTRKETQTPADGPLSVNPFTETLFGNHVSEVISALASFTRLSGLVMRCGDFRIQRPLRSLLIGEVCKHFEEEPGLLLSIAGDPSYYLPAIGYRTLADHETPRKTFKSRD